MPREVAVGLSRLDDVEKAHVDRWWHLIAQLHVGGEKEARTGGYKSVEMGFCSRPALHTVPN